MNMWGFHHSSSSQQQQQLQHLQQQQQQQLQHLQQQQQQSQNPQPQRNSGGGLFSRLKRGDSPKKNRSSGGDNNNNDYDNDFRQLRPDTVTDGRNDSPDRRKRFQFLQRKQTPQAHNRDELVSQQQQFSFVSGNVQSSNNQRREEQYRSPSDEDAYAGGNNADNVGSGGGASKVLSHKPQISVVYHRFGKPPVSNFIVVEQEDRIPKPRAEDHVIVKVQASTVSLNDCLLRRGFCFSLLNPVSLPVIPGHDVVGHVINKGNDVKEYNDGDRVAAFVRIGGNARYISIPESCLVRVPRVLDAAEAAAMVSIYTAAYQAIKKVSSSSSSSGQRRLDANASTAHMSTTTGAIGRDVNATTLSLANKKVLIVGGMDAVGQALIEMCLKARVAEIYATVPDSCFYYVKHVLNAIPLSETNPSEWLIEGIKGEMDLVFDGVCEDGLLSSFKALNPTGRLVCYGQSSMLRENDIGFFGAPMSAHVNKFWSQTKPRTVRTDLHESYLNDPETYKKNLKSLFQLLKFSKIKPRIFKRISLGEVASAQERLEVHGDVRGIIVCMPFKKIVDRTSSDSSFIKNIIRAQNPSAAHNHHHHQHHHTAGNGGGGPDNNRGGGGGNHHNNGYYYNNQNTLGQNDQLNDERRE